MNQQATEQELTSALPQGLAAWAERSLAAGEHVLATSNQGTVLRHPDYPLVIKSAMGGVATRRARQATLDREYAAYQRLRGLAGVPRCHGMLEGRYLVLDFVAGTPFREAELPDREQWFARLLEIILACHDRGVAHGDLKNKSNLLSDRNGQPCLIDFGTTALQKEGLHPINNWLHRFLCQLDLNAWVKLKCGGRFDTLSEEDRALFKDSAIERLLRWGRQRAGLQGQRA